MGCVYVATNNINGKRYVGQTIHSLAVRKRQHIGASKNKNRKEFHAFQAAISKYGEENFSWEILFESENPAELDKMEIFYIKELKTFGNLGYNLTMGGGGNYKNFPIKVVCINCGNEFEVPKYKYEQNISNNHNFICGKICKSEYQSKRNVGNLYGKSAIPISVVCDICGNKYEVSKQIYTQHQQRNTKFCCSKECVIKSRKTRMQANKIARKNV